MKGIPLSPPRAGVVLMAMAVAACTGGRGASSDTTSQASGTLASAPSAQVMVRGTISTVSATQLSIASDSGAQTVQLTQPVAIYDRQPGTLGDVKPNSFVGVTSVKQTDGSEQATEIHVFPEELRGLGEGSHMMTAPSGLGTNNRMTNGAVSGGGGAAAPSRMSNGAVASTSGSTLIVQYAGGSQTITVPANTPVTAISATTKPLAAGDKVVALARRNADGTLTTQKVLLSNK